MTEADAERSTIDVALAVACRQGRVLIGLRPSGVPLAGYWEFPGGKCLPGEAPRTAAAREGLEETGLELLVGFAYPPVMHRYRHATVRLHFFDCQVHSMRPPRAPFRWIDLGQLPAQRFPPANASILAALARRASPQACRVSLVRAAAAPAASVALEEWARRRPQIGLGSEPVDDYTLQTLQIATGRALRQALNNTEARR